MSNTDDARRVEHNTYVFQAALAIERQAEQEQPGAFATQATTGGEGRRRGSPMTGPRHGGDRRPPRTPVPARPPRPPAAADQHDGTMPALFLTAASEAPASETPASEAPASEALGSETLVSVYVKL